MFIFLNNVVRCSSIQCHRDRIRWANRGQKVHRPSPTVITLRNLSVFSIFGLSGFTKKVCGPVKKMRAKKVNKSCDIEENKHFKKNPKWSSRQK